MLIALTRPEGQNEELAERVRALGHEVVVCPLIAVEPLGDEPVELDGYDWLVVTSPNGAREIARRGRGRPKHVAAIGAATAAALPFAADLVPSVSTQEGLLAELPQPPGRVLLAAAQDARRLLVDSLAAEFVPLYRTRELAPETFPDADAVVLASPSAARAFASLAREVPVVTIGPQTTAEAERLGLHVALQAETHDVAGLAEAVDVLSGARYTVSVDVVGWTEWGGWDQLEALTSAVDGDPRSAGSSVAGPPRDMRSRSARLLRPRSPAPGSVSVTVRASTVDEAREVAADIVRGAAAHCGITGRPRVTTLWDNLAGGWIDSD